MDIRLLDTGIISGAANMALDSIILEEVESGASPPTLRFLRFGPPVALVGYNQDVGSEIRADYCRQNHIDINRRITGGGAILFEPSMLGFGLYWPTNAPSLGRDFGAITRRLAGIAARAITDLGAPAAFRPRNDIEINGRKVSGTGMVFYGKAWMFQGTLLMENCMETMLRALRVPVEKLKRREIQSLLQRLTFLADEVGGMPDMAGVKAAFARAYETGLGYKLANGGLTEREQQRLDDELPYYDSDQWVQRRRLSGEASQVLRSQSGRMTTALFTDAEGKKINQALITGDFFCRPQRLIMDVEGILRGAPLKPVALRRTLEDYLNSADHEIVGISREQFVDCVIQAAEKGAAPWPGFRAEDLNEVHPISMDLDMRGWQRPARLLLPYCAKDLKCPQRHEDGCDQCGLCDIGDMYDLADRCGIKPVTITSFEHLMAEIEDIGKTPGETYVGSCCQAFLAKHQHEMAEAGVKGVIVGLNSLTCYDLGKETDAYAGTFEKQSQMETALFSKVVRFLTKDQ